MTSRVYQKFKASGQQFEIETKYDFVRPIGHGAYGIVISAFDKNNNKKVAIKKITRVFDDPVDAKRILREIKLMKKFHHENVTRILDLCPPSPENREFDDIYIVQDLMETDLHRIIYSKQELSLEHIQYFIYQILRGLKYIHSANVIHRDLKPSNILVNGNCDLKICDFGLARGVEDEQLGGLTEYVVTRWYRAPEIMLACHEYTKAIDIWSVGCILAELLGRQALFPGNDYLAQLRLICEKLGRPTEDQMDFITSDRAKRFIFSLPDSTPIDMMELFPDYQEEKTVTDLFQQMMIFHPSYRITIDDALKHPFMASLHNPDDEPVANFTFQFPFENEALSKERIQELIWEEIYELHPDIPKTFPSSNGHGHGPTHCPNHGPSLNHGHGQEEEGVSVNQKKRNRASSSSSVEALDQDNEGRSNGNGGNVSATAPAAAAVLESNQIKGDRTNTSHVKNGEGKDNHDNDDEEPSMTRQRTE